MLMSVQEQINEIMKKIGIQQDPDTLHAYAECYRRKLKNVICWKVQPNYYQLPLEERALQLNGYCRSYKQLTKCLFYENRIADVEARDPIYSRYYCIIYQYDRKFSMPKFHNFLKNSKKDVARYAHLTKQSYKWHYVPADVAQVLCNAGYNGMSPIGLTDMKIPVVVDSLIESDDIFVGGLHEQVKARIQVTELVNSFVVLRAEVSDPLLTNEVEEVDKQEEMFD